MHYCNVLLEPAIVLNTFHFRGQAARRMSRDSSDDDFESVYVAAEGECSCVSCSCM